MTWARVSNAFGSVGLAVRGLRFPPGRLPRTVLAVNAPMVTVPILRYNLSMAGRGPPV